MKKNTLIIFLMFSLVGVFAQITPHELIEKAGTGYNAGNIMNSPDEGDWDPVFEEFHFFDIKNAGFNNVRIPIRWDKHTSAAPPWTVDPAWLARVEQVVDWSLAHGLVTIFDAHGEQDWFTSNAQDADTLDRFKAIWEQVAFHFKDKSEDLIFEIINEPYFEMSKDEVDDLNRIILPIIRAENPTRCVMITGGGKNSWEAPLQIDPSILASDDYLIATYHYYLPREYVTTTEDILTFGTPAEKALIDLHFNLVKSWSLEHDVPVYLGEYGANNVSDPTSRHIYNVYIAEQATNRAFASATWCTGVGGKKYIYDRTTPGSFEQPMTSDMTTAGIWGSVIPQPGINVISNYDFEQGIDVDWSFSLGGAAEATISDAGAENAYNGNSAVLIDVTTADLHNKAFIKSIKYTGNFSGISVDMSCYAKASTAVQDMKLRIRSYDGSNNLLGSIAKSHVLSMDTYQYYNNIVQLPEGTTQIEISALCGAVVGEYYIDDFKATIPDPTPALSSIIITPTSAAIAEGGQVQFSAEGFDQYNDPIAATFQWTTNPGATVDATGLFTSSLAGVYSVRATANGVSQSARITVGNPDQQPNIVFIAIDDLKPWLNCYGETQAVTPAIDALAASGVVFKNAHCQWAVCGPSRASLLTGKYIDVTGVDNLTKQLRDITPDIQTIPRYFKDNGYTTAAFGKVFDDRNVDAGHDAISWTEPYTDPYDYDYPPEYGDFVGGVKYRVTDNTATEQGPEGVGFDGYQDGQICLDALSQIDDYAAGTDPFFLAVGFKKPHVPFVAPKEYWDLYNRADISVAPFQRPAAGSPEYVYSTPEPIQYVDIPDIWTYDDVMGDNILDIDLQKELLHGYYACVSYADDLVQKVVDKIEEHGMTNNTIFVLYGDHGYHLGDHNQWGKHTNFEASTHAPLIIKVPGKPANVYTEPVDLIDMFPTLCDLAELSKPTDLQGVSLKTVIDGNLAPVKECAVTEYRAGSHIGYSFRTNQHRYTIWMEGTTQTTDAVAWDPALILDEELFDYVSDPLESVNLATDPGYATVLADMKTKAEEWWNSQREYFGHSTGGGSSDGKFITVNPGFEEGVSNGWTTYFKSGEAEGTISESFDVSDGSKSAMLNVTLGGSGASNASLKTDKYTTDDILKGATMRVTMDAKCSNPGNVIQIQVQITDNQSSVTRITSSGIALTDTWQSYSFDVDFPTDNVEWQILFQVGGNTPAQYYFDKCVLDTVPTVQDPPVLTTITVTPGSATIGEGQSVQFSAEALDQYGSTYATSISWSTTSGASIDQTGLFTSSTAGTYTVTATAEGVDGNATAQVDEAAVLTTITVTPGSATIDEGQSVQFSAEALDQYGSTYATSISWSTTSGASIDQTGLFTSSTAGAYTVTATAEGIDGNATAQVNEVTVNPIINPGFELGVNTGWSFNVSGTASATIAEGSGSDVTEGVKSCYVNVKKTGFYGSVSTSTDTYLLDPAHLSLTASIDALGTGRSQSIKIEFEFNDGSGGTTTSTSAALSVEKNVFTNLSYAANIPAGSQSYSIKIMSGSVRGGYYFDNTQVVFSTSTKAAVSEANEITNVSDIQVYPNPVRDILTISGATIQEASLYTFTGRTIRIQQVNNNEIDVSQLPVGLYVLRAKTIDGQVYTKQISVTH